MNFFLENFVVTVSKKLCVFWRKWIFLRNLMPINIEKSYKRTVKK